MTGWSVWSKRCSQPTAYGREYSEMPVAADGPTELVLDVALASDHGSN